MFMFRAKCPKCGHEQEGMLEKEMEFVNTVRDVLHGVTVHDVLTHGKETCTKLILEFALHFTKEKQAFMDKEFEK